MRVLGGFDHRPNVPARPRCVFSEFPASHVDSTRNGLSLAVLPPDLPCSPSRGFLGSRRSRGRDYHISRRTRHELQELTMGHAMGMSPF